MRPCTEYFAAPKPFNNVMTTTPAESPVRAFAAGKSGEALQSYRFALGGVAPGEVSVAAFPLIEDKKPRRQRDWFERNPRHALFFR